MTTFIYPAIAAISMLKKNLDKWEPRTLPNFNGKGPYSKPSFKDKLERFFVPGRTTQFLREIYENDDD